MANFYKNSLNLVTQQALSSGKLSSEGNDIIQKGLNGDSSIEIIKPDIYGYHSSNMLLFHDKKNDRYVLASLGAAHRVVDFKPTDQLSSRDAMNKWFGDPQNEDFIASHFSLYHQQTSHFGGKTLVTSLGVRSALQGFQKYSNDHYGTNHKTKYSHTTDNKVGGDDWNSNKEIIQNKTLFQSDWANELVNDEYERLKSDGDTLIKSDAEYNTQIALSITQGVLGAASLLTGIGAAFAAPAAAAFLGALNLSLDIAGGAIGVGDSLWQAIWGDTPEDRAGGILSLLTEAVPFGLDLARAYPTAINTYKAKKAHDAEVRKRQEHVGNSAPTFDNVANRVQTRNPWLTFALDQIPIPVAKRTVSKTTVETFPETPTGTVNYLKDLITTPFQHLFYKQLHKLRLENLKNFNFDSNTNKYVDPDGKVYKGTDPAAQLFLSKINEQLYSDGSKLDHNYIESFSPSDSIVIAKKGEYYSNLLPGFKIPVPGGKLFLKGGPRYNKIAEEKFTISRNDDGTFNAKLTITNESKFKVPLNVGVGFGHAGIIGAVIYTRTKKGDSYDFIQSGLTAEKAYEFFDKFNNNKLTLEELTLSQHKKTTGSSAVVRPAKAGAFSRE